MQDSEVLNEDIKNQIDDVLEQLEKLCQESPQTKAYAAAKVLRVPYELKDFQRVISDFKSQLTKLGYFQIDEKPQMNPDQVEEILKNRAVLKEYELIKEEDKFRLVSPQTDQTAYYVHYYPRFIENSQFWGWGIQFRHPKNPRLDVSWDYNGAATHKKKEENLETTRN